MRGPIAGEAGTTFRRVGGAAPPGEWGRAAGCAQPGVDPVLREVFTTDASTPWDGDAVRVCRACPVRAACTAYAATIHPDAGIWGGWRRIDPATARRLSVPVATISR